jgi:hypothetical protein
MDKDTYIPRSWFMGCNTQALRSVLFLLSVTPAWRDRVVRAGGEKGHHDKKPWHVRTLVRLQLRYGDIADLVTTLTPSTLPLGAPGPRTPSARQGGKPRALPDPPVGSSTTLLIKAMSNPGLQSSLAALAESDLVLPSHST